MLTRTQHGLRNIHLFYRVDYVIYTEGSEPLALDNIDHKKNNEIGHDASFWSGIFSQLRPDIRFKINSVGSKTVLKEIVRTVIDDNIHSIVVAMDRDHDTHRGLAVADRRVIYTLGYSWENDVINCDGVSDLFYALCPMCRATVNISEEFREYLESVRPVLNRAAYADFLALVAGGGIFNRKKPEEFFMNSQTGYPTLDQRRFREKLRDIRGRFIQKSRPRRRASFSFERDLVGKSFASLVYRWLLARCKKIRRVTLDKNFFLGSLINSFLVYVVTDRTSLAHKHYKERLSAL